MTRKMLLLAVCSVLLTSTASTLADQNDVRLDDLFQVMAQTDIEQIAADAQQQIWAIWMQHDDKDVQVRLHQAVAAMDQDSARALVLLSELTRDVPDFAEGWNKRATLYYLLGDYAASLKDIERTLELEPRHFGALSGRGLVHLALNQFDEALSAFEAVLLLQPSSRSAQQNIRLINRYLRRTSI